MIAVGVARTNAHGQNTTKMVTDLIISNVKRYARSFYVSSLPRSCIFPELFRSLYMFGDINTSIYIEPIQEAKSQLCFPVNLKIIMFLNIITLL